MIEDFERVGFCWLPDDPNLKLFGTLKYIPGTGASLKLHGELESIKRLTASPFREILLGTSLNDEVTLFQCYYVGGNFRGEHDLSDASFDVDMVFVGLHFRTTNDIKLKVVSAKYSHLHEWAGVSGFADPELGEGTYDELIAYKAPAPIQAVGNKYKISIVFGFSESGFTFPRKYAHIEQIAGILLESPDPISPKKLREFIRKTQYFLCLGVAQPVYPLRIAVRLEQADFASAQVFFAFPHFLKEPKRIEPIEMLFTLDDFGTKLESAMKNWFENELFDPVFDSYFGAAYNPRMYLEDTFLNYVKALEAYHERFRGRYKLQREAYEKLADEVIAYLPNWARSVNKLKNLNKPHLIMRVLEILNYFEDIASHLRIANPINRRVPLCQKVLDSRNYYTHYDRELGPVAAKGQELYEITIKLRLLLQICLLTELGFTLADIERLIRERHYFIQFFRSFSD